MVEKNNAMWQDLHSDWYSYPTSSMQWGYSLCCSIACHDIDADHGAMRAYSWSEPFMRDEQNYHRMPLEKEMANWFPCESRISMLAGECLIRDCRAAHGGTANLEETDRILPGFKVWSPQYTQHVREQKRGIEWFMPHVPCNKYAPCTGNRHMHHATGIELLMP